MTARQQADIIARSVRASLQQVVDRGQTLNEALALGIDRAIANNAAQALSFAEDDESGAA